MIPEFTVEKLRRPKKRVRVAVKFVVTLGVWFFVIGLIVFLSYFIYLQRTIPDPETIVSRKVGESTKIYDSTGEVLLYDIHGEEKRTIVPWDQIPETVKKATLASEDSEFYTHRGLDFSGIARAFLKNIRTADISQGGSTITQQLIKNRYLSGKKTFERKFEEARIALEFEHKS